MSSVSVVIPTFNRGDKLPSVLNCLLASDPDGLQEIEVIVVDDGSRVPARAFVSSRTVSPPFSLEYIYQENAGPAAARNRGYGKTRHNVVLFMDDDILVPPNLVKQHVRAHQLHPGAVIFGHCRPVSQPPLMHCMPPPEASLVQPIRPDQHYLCIPHTRDVGGKKANRHPEVNLLTFLESLDPRQSRKQRLVDFEPVSVVASGHISVERNILGSKVYDIDLQTPAAEEFALAERLRRAGIPILQAADIEALHWSDMKIGTVCRQQYTHGLGCAEVACKYPECLELPELRNTLSAHGYFRPRNGSRIDWKIRAKSFLTTYPMRSGLLKISRLVERFLPFYSINATFYRMVLGVYYMAGIKDGMLRFGKRSI